jgi:hypothetical protein
MSMRSMLVSLAALVVAAPIVLRAQETSAEFQKARQQYIAGEARPAAQTLLIASLHLRQQVGRSKDETVGMRLLDAEGQLEKLAAALKAGTVTSVRTLDLTLTAIDRLLAQHHLQMVNLVIAKPRADDVPVAVRDLDRAAFHYERSITLNGGRIASEQAVALADARALSKEMDVTRAVPKTAAGIVATLERHVLGISVITAAQQQ